MNGALPLPDNGKCLNNTGVMNQQLSKSL